jgi:hypothetical protein
MTPPRFSPDDLDAFRAAKILGVRSGSDHRPTGVWVVVVAGRVFVRSWNDRPTGWFRAFLAEPRGSGRLPDRELPVLGIPTPDEALQRAVTAAYAEKYPTSGSRKWVEGFAEEARMRTTLELVPG